MLAALFLSTCGEEFTMASLLQEVALKCEPFGGRVSVYLFGMPLDWNIGGDEQKDVLKRLGHLSEELSVADIFAPRPSMFNAQICDPVDLVEQVRISQKVSFFNTMYRGCDADGVEIPQGKAFWLSSADCITIVVHHPESGKTVAAHGGRDCLIDKERIRGGKSRQYESVVHAMVAQYGKNEVRQLEVFMTCGISPENFSHSCDHEQHGPANTRMVLDVLAKWGPTCLEGDHFQGKIALSEVVRSQFIKLGVKPHSIGWDAVDTFTNRGRDGEYRWWSYRRGDGKKRNGVLVVRNW